MDSTSGGRPVRSVPRPRHLRLVRAEPDPSGTAHQVASFVELARLLLPTSGLPTEREELVRQDLRTLRAELLRDRPRESVCQAIVASVVEELTSTDPVA